MIDSAMDASEHATTGIWFDAGFDAPRWANAREHTYMENLFGLFKIIVEKEIGKAG